MNTNTTAPFPVIGILGLILITLKLCNIIAWSWLWVLAPFWAPLVVAAMFIAFSLLLIVLGTVIGSFKIRRRK